LTTPSTSTTSTVAPNSGGTVAPPVPKIQAVAAGEAGVKVGDSVESAVVERVDNKLVVSAGELKATLGGLGTDGSAMPLDEDGNVRLKSGDSVRITLAGFKPGSTVEAWLFSTPVLMGIAKVGADGQVSGNFVVPRNAPDGAHRIAIVARTKDGKPATLTVGVMVGEWESAGGVAVWLIVLPIVLAVLGALVLPATRRRRNPRNA
jgi:protein involved in polysaccharide export with SLBB domain